MWRCTTRDSGKVELWITCCSSTKKTPDSPHQKVLEQVRLLQREKGTGISENTTAYPKVQTLVAGNTCGVLEKGKRLELIFILWGSTWFCFRTKTFVKVLSKPRLMDKIVNKILLKPLGLWIMNFVWGSI